MEDGRGMGDRRRGWGVPQQAGQGPGAFGVGGGYVVGVNAHKHREAERRNFVHLPCSSPFQLVTTAGDSAGGPGEPQGVSDGSGWGPCSLPGSYVCPRSPRVGPGAMLTPAVPQGKRNMNF